MALKLAFVLTSILLLLSVSTVQAKSDDFDVCRQLAADPFDPRTPQAGQMLSNLNYKAARPVCQRALNMNPDDPLLLYWALRANLAAGMQTDAQLVQTLDAYIKLRNMGEHKLALYHLKIQDDELRDAMTKHEKNIKNPYYWCERQFCGFQLNKDYNAAFPGSELNLIHQYARDNYIPAISFLSIHGCGYIGLDTGQNVTEFDAAIHQRFKDGEEIIQQIFAYGFYKMAEIRKDYRRQVNQKCGPALSDNGIQKYILPVLTKYSNKAPFYADYSALIGAVETDIYGSAPRRAGESFLAKAEAKVANRTLLSSTELDQLAQLSTSSWDYDIWQYDSLRGRALNLLALMEIRGIQVPMDKKGAMKKWLEVVENRSIYLNVAVLNLLSNSELLTQSELEKLIYSANDDWFYQVEEIIVFLGFLFEYPDFENVYANTLNLKARNLLSGYVQSDQLRGDGYAPSNPTQAERIYEWLNAEGIQKSEETTAAVIAAIVGTLAVIGSNIQDSPISNTEFDSCAGLNGIGIISNGAGNASALFGCSKY